VGKVINFGAFGGGERAVTAGGAGPHRLCAPAGICCAGIGSRNQSDNAQHAGPIIAPIAELCAKSGPRLRVKTERLRESLLAIGEAAKIRILGQYLSAACPIRGEGTNNLLTFAPKFVHPRQGVVKKIGGHDSH
jgi:hypothetical protein